MALEGHKKKANALGPKGIQAPSRSFRVLEKQITMKVISMGFNAAWSKVTLVSAERATLHNNKAVRAKAEGVWFLLSSSTLLQKSRH